VLAVSLKEETAEDSDAEERSLTDRGRELFKSSRERVQTAAGTLSGKNIEGLVAEYSEQYTQVLLGMHKDLMAQARDIEKQDSRIDMLERHVTSVRVAPLTAVLALVVAVVALGVAIWAAL
jgi:hypothetical protein